jgi:hypothetical protein
MLDLDEGEIERLGVDHIVLDALPPRTRNVALERRRARAAARLLEQEGRHREAGGRHGRRNNDYQQTYKQSNLRIQIPTSVRPPGRSFSSV